jgi:pyruvate dehydrogenase E2 component (dihydrolipoamide acetyltransferase)
VVHEIILPKLGQTMETGTIVEWLKQEGDPVAPGDVLFTVESDKALLEVEAHLCGFLRRILTPVGLEVDVLTVVALITRTADEKLEWSTRVSGLARAVQDEPADGRDIADEGRSNEEQLIEGAHHLPTRLDGGGERGRIFVSPRARKRAQEAGMDLSLVQGTGPNGRIVEQDVLAFRRSTPSVTPVARRMATEAGVDLSNLSGSGRGGRITRSDVEQVLRSQAAAPALISPDEDESEITDPIVPMTAVRRQILHHMAESSRTVAAVTLTTEADASTFVTVQRRLKERLAPDLGFDLGYNELFVKIAARALRNHPDMNARLEGAGESSAICQLSEVNVGLAVDTERGLLVPVVHNAAEKGLADIAREIRTLVTRARAGKASLDDLNGGTFTVTNLGMFGIDAFTPIINLPEAAILGVGRIKERLTLVNGQPEMGQCIWLSLTFDHRLVDGALAARFLQEIKKLVEEPLLLVA